MWKAALAGVMLAMAGATCVSAQESTYETASIGPARPASQSAPTITEGHIARLRNALRLRPEQLQLWHAVESALRNLAHRKKDTAPVGVVARWSNRAVNAVSEANGMRRLASAATPLIGSLDEKQKQDGMRVVRASGLASLASAF